MTDYLSPKVYNGSAWGRLRLSLTHSPTTVTSATASVDVTAALRFESSSAVVDSVNLGQMSGDLGSWADSTSINHGSSGGSTLLHTRTVAVALAYGAQVNVDVAGSLTNIEALPGTMFLDVDYLLPARPYAVPAAPTGVVVSRNSDISHTVTWTRNPTTAGPYSSQKVQRWDNVTAAWATVATVAGTAASYTDTTTAANRSYRYRVQAINTSGTSTSAETGLVYTTPAAPTSATATKSGSSIVVAWSGVPSYGAYETQVWESQDGGVYVLLATAAAGAGSYTHAAPSAAVTHRYQVRHKTTTGTTLYSGWATTATVQLAAPPNAPTGLGPSTVRDATEDVTLHWTHNPVDTSAQTAFQVRHRAVGAPTWTTVGPITSGLSEWVLPGGSYANPTAVEWQVATRGQHATFSPWSATATLPASARPTVAIASPTDGSTVDTSTLTVSWAYFDAEGTLQTAWQVDLLDDTGELVEARSGVGAATSTGLTTVLADGSAWTVRARVQDADGMWSVADVAAIDVSYALPPVPTLSLAWDPDAATVTVTVTVPEPVEGEVDADHVNLWRAIDDGPWRLIAAGVPLATAITDYAPTIAGTNRYRAEAVSLLPSVATSAIVEQVTPLPGDPSTVFLSGGQGFSVVCRGVANVLVLATTDLAERVLHRFAGRERPVEFAGTGTARVWSVALDVITPSSGPAATPPEAWLTLGALPGPHLLRTPDGLYVWCSVSGITAQRAPGGAVTTISFTATEVDDA